MYYISANQSSYRKYGQNLHFCSALYIMYFCRHLWSCSDFWPLGYKMLSFHCFVPLDIYVKFCHKKCMNSWVVDKNFSCHRDLDLWPPNSTSSSMSECLCQIWINTHKVFLRYRRMIMRVGQTERQLKKVMPPAPDDASVGIWGVPLHTLGL